MLKRKISPNKSWYLHFRDLFIEDQWLSCYLIFDTP